MENNIPFFLKKNLNALKKYFPNLYKIFKDYKLKDNHKLTCNENGEPNILLSDGNLFYGESPFDDCKNQVEEFLLNQRLKSLTLFGCGQEANPYHQIHFIYKNKLNAQALKIRLKYDAKADKTKLESIPFMVMYGLGLGYHLSYLYENFTPINLYIIEPNRDFFYLSLCVFDYATLIDYIDDRNLGLKFIFSDDENEILRDLDNYTYRYSMNLSVKSFYAHYSSEPLKKTATLIRKELPSLSFKSGFFDDTLTGMCQCYKNFMDGNKLLSNRNLSTQFSSIPVLVVGNGPSLDDDLELIKNIRNKVCILACGTALTTLINYGITPDFYVAVERTPNVYEDSLAQIEDESVFDEVLCFAPDLVHPQTIAKFKHKLLGLKMNEVIGLALWKLGIYPNLRYCASLNYINPLVSNMGSAIATVLGFKNIYFVGIDNGSAYKEAHSIYSCYYDENHQLTDKAKKNVLNKLPLTHQGNFIDTVKTNSLFKISIHVFEELISKHKHKCNYFNSSNGAKIVGADPKHLSEIKWNDYPPYDRVELQNYILNNLSVSLFTPQTVFDHILKPDRFIEVADILINDLNNLPKTREEIVLRLEQHIDFLNNLDKEKSRAIGRALNGSLQMLYGCYLTALYCIPDQHQAIEETHYLLKTIIAFLEKTKELYPQTYEYSYDFVKNLEISVDNL